MNDFLSYHQNQVSLSLFSGVAPLHVESYQIAHICCDVSVM